MRAVVLLFTFSWGGWALASTAAPCVSLYKQKQYQRAGHCFARLAKQMGPASKLSGQKRYAKRAFLHNAARSWRQAVGLAIKGSAFQQLPYIREQLLGVYVSLHGLAPSPRLKQKQKELRLLIGYARFEVWTTAKAQVCVEGYRYRRCETGSRWSAQLRPGRYRVKVRLRPSGKQKLYSIQVHPNTPSSHRFFPPKRRGPQKPATLDLKTTPSGVEVYVDGKHRGLTPLVFQVPEGTHKLVLKRECYFTIEQTVVLQASRTRRSHLVLKARPKYQAWLERRKRPNYVRLAAIIALSAAGVGLVFGGIGHVAAQIQHQSAQDIQSQFDEGKLLLEDARARFKEAAHSGNQWRTVGHIGLFTGALLGGVGLLLHLQARPPAPPQCSP